MFRKFTNFCSLAILILVVACNDQRPSGAVANLNLNRPNVLLIVADDMGFTDIGSFGSEIQTPNIDALANQGTRFSRFYSGSMCAPTRAMLMTGTDHHVAGMGNMAEFMTKNQSGNPGYEGYLNDRVVALPKLLADNGYHTYMVGKWHLGYEHDQSPRVRGFERSFVLLNGAASHFDDMGGSDIHRPIASYREDGELIDSLPKGFYSSHSYTNKLIDQIESNRADGEPFFAYAAYTSPHFPLHAPADVRDKYVGLYDEGYDVIRAKRHREVKRQGLIPDHATIPARPDFIPPWLSMTQESRNLAAREMEVYAAMVDDLDRNIGRLITYLKENGLIENTLIVFMSDNGSDAFSLAKAPDAIKQNAAKYDNSLANIGKKNSFSFIGPNWAHVGEAPFRLYKSMPTEGGIRVPAIITLPKTQLGKNQVQHINNSVVSVMDLVPTILDLAGIDYSNLYQNIEGITLDGRSLMPILSGQTHSIRTDNDVLGSELLGRRAIIKGNWKIINLPKPIGSGIWELFNIMSDPGEQNNLAKDMPDKLADLIVEWDKYAIEKGIILQPPGPLQVNALKSPVK